MHIHINEASHQTEGMRVVQFVEAEEKAESLFECVCSDRYCAMPMAYR